MSTTYNNSLEEISARIRKLLALSQSDNEAEAALAAARAQELLKKHNLDIGVLSRPAEAETGQAHTARKGRYAPHEYVLAHAVDALLDTKHYRINYGKWGGGASLVFVGLKANVEAATITYSYLLAAIEECLKARKRNGHLYGSSDMREYRYGAAIRIRRMINDRKQQEKLTGDTQSQALVRVSCEVAQKLYDQATAGFRSFSYSRPNGGDAYHMGFSDGAGINPHAARGNRQLGSR